MLRLLGGRSMAAMINGGFMKTLRKTAAALLTLGALGLAMALPAAPAAAGTTTPSVAALPATSMSAAVVTADYSRKCVSGWVISLADRLPIRKYPKHDADVLLSAQKGDHLFCLTGKYSLGDRYTACGVSNANGWLYIDTNSSKGIGYAYMTCLADPSGLAATTS
ncbi:hypothetical protein [Micromonospora sp. HK10]|uniref:hypothetical protein n=1 Tax=Micromonospora sp. HK10 TaxID=1538294 RepID=UPI0006987D6D|nr:hypothetical protein [Micromonospora sp. HK10]